MAKEIRDKSDVVCNFYQWAEDVPDPRELSPEKKNLMVFDDLLLENKIAVNRIMSDEDRATLIASIYLKTISSCRVKQSEKTRISCLFPEDLKNLNHIFEDHVGSDMTKEEFRHLCKTAWEKQHGFVIIDLSSKKHNGKYRSGLDEFYIAN